MTLALWGSLASIFLLLKGLPLLPAKVVTPVWQQKASELGLHGHNPERTRKMPSSESPLRFSCLGITAGEKHFPSTESKERLTYTESQKASQTRLYFSNHSGSFKKKNTTYIWGHQGWLCGGGTKAFTVSKRPSNDSAVWPGLRITDQHNPALQYMG